MATLFECAIIVNEKRDASNNIVEAAELVKEPFYLVAANQNQATLMAGKSVPQDIIDDPQRFDRAVIIVRPF